MFAWLNGVGKVFRDPLPGSTNYLNAYYPDGTLVRLAKSGENKGAQDEAEEAEANLDRHVSQLPSYSLRAIC